jgi:hypothetical protein
MDYLAWDRRAFGVSQGSFNFAMAKQVGGIKRVHRCFYKKRNRFPALRPGAWRREQREYQQQLFYRAAIPTAQH